MKKPTQALTHNKTKSSNGEYSGCMAQVSCDVSFLAPRALVNGRGSGRAERDVSQQNRNRMEQRHGGANCAGSQSEARLRPPSSYFLAIHKPKPGELR
jgi:hypothetical protein